MWRVHLKDLRALRRLAVSLLDRTDVIVLYGPYVYHARGLCGYNPEIYIRESGLWWDAVGIFTAEPSTRFRSWQGFVWDQDRGVPDVLAAALGGTHFDPDKIDEDHCPSYTFVELPPKLFPSPEDVLERIGLRESVEPKGGLYAVTWVLSEERCEKCGWRLPADPWYKVCPCSTFPETFWDPREAWLDRIMARARDRTQEAAQEETAQPAETT